MKHIRFVITACTLLCAFTLFSCASKPKADSKIQGEIEDYLNSETADAKQESGASTGLSSETADEETDRSDADNTETNISIADAPIEEPLTEEQNPELPELPEDNITENKRILTEEPAISPEPEVKDAVDNAAQNQNITLAQNSENSAAVAESASSAVSTTLPYSSFDVTTHIGVFNVCGGVVSHLSSRSLSYTVEGIKAHL